MNPQTDRTHHNARLPARFRPTRWARLHYLCWNLLFILLWPVSWIIYGFEKLRRHD